MVNINKISKIPLKEEFPHEAHDFTPWLKKNLHYIEEELHLKFGDNALTEVEVGRYSCDVFVETVDGKKVVIENQFERADHPHLGKMLTYAAGLDADMLIWIAEEFGDEEIATLNWLNSISPEETPVFFAVQIGLIKIGSSEPGLDIDIIVQPDKWSKKVIKRKNENMKAEKYFGIWNNFIEYFSNKRNELKTKPTPRTNWINIPSKTKDFEFTFMFAEGKTPAIQLWIGRSTQEENEVIFNKLKEHQHDLVDALPNLIWVNDPTNKSKKIMFLRDKDYNFSEEEQEDVFEWFVQAMEKFEKSFNPLLEEISVK
jgi:hypothetical protein